MLRASLCLLASLLLIAFSGALSGLHVTDYLDVSFLFPLLGVGLALASTFSWQDFAELGRQLRGKGGDDPAALQRSKVLLRSGWTHLWQMSALLLLLQLMASLHHSQEPDYLGKLLWMSLEAAIYLVLLRSLVFLPAELSLARRQSSTRLNTSGIKDSEQAD